MKACKFSAEKSKARHETAKEKQTRLRDEAEAADTSPHTPACWKSPTRVFLRDLFFSSFCAGSTEIDKTSSGKLHVKGGSAWTPAGR